MYFYNLHMIEEKGYYSLDKVFTRIIEQYPFIYLGKSYLLNMPKSTRKFGTLFPNGAGLNYSKIASY